MSVQVDDYAELIQQLQCSVCHQWLTVFPIYFNLSQEFVCGRHICEDSYTPAKFFESFVKIFKFPCVYQQYGCKKLLNVDQLQEHESDCTYEPINCPHCRNWKGDLQGLNLHIDSAHVILNPPIIDLPTLINPDFSIKTYFIKENAQLFTIQIKYFGEGIQVLVMLNGKEPDNELFNYQLQFYKNDANNTLAFPYYKTEAFNNSYNAAKFIEIKLSMIYSALQMKSNVIKMKIVILTKQKLTEQNKSDIDLNNIRENLECAVCLEEMTPPIVMCQTGHSFCKECCPTLQNCPLCKCLITSTRNYALERMLNNKAKVSETPISTDLPILLTPGNNIDTETIILPSSSTRILQPMLWERWQL